jgi:hypothetical protein
MMLSKNKKGLSGIVITLLLVALAIILVSIVWTVVSNLVNEKLNQAGSCFDVFDKISLNNQFTCYDYGENRLHISINRGDAELDGIVVAIGTETESSSFTLAGEDKTIDNLWYYGSSGEENVKMPDGSSGVTYVYDWSENFGSEGAPILIQIAPVVGENQCEVSDTLTEIPSCSQLT